MARSKNFSAPSTVRAWATENGHTVGARGRFQPEVVKAFNAAHKNAPYAPKAFESTVIVTAKRDGQPPIRGKVNVSKARATLLANGVQVGARGRLTPENLAKALLLSREAAQTEATPEA